MAKEHVHALKGLACRKRVARRRERRTLLAGGGRRASRSHTLAAAPGLLAHASVTGTVKFCRVGPKLKHIAVHALLTPNELQHLTRL
jgi:hypothetical protein